MIIEKISIENNSESAHTVPDINFTFTRTDILFILLHQKQYTS
jgi:hypothetical protein